MNRVTISIPKELDLNFRQKAAMKFAFERGWYGKAILEAMEFWINYNTDKNLEIPVENKSYLWNNIKNEIKIDEDDPQIIMNSIMDYFKNLKFVNNLKYEIDGNKVFMKKENSIESFAPYLVTRENESIFLSCPIKAVAGTALKEITGRDYQIMSNEDSLLYIYDISKVMDKESLKIHL